MPLRLHQLSTNTVNSSCVHPLPSTAGHGVAQHGVAQHGMVQHGTVGAKGHGTAVQCKWNIPHLRLPVRPDTTTKHPPFAHQGPSASLEVIPRSREVGQSYITSVGTTLYSLAFAAWVVLKQRPGLVSCSRVRMAGCGC